MKNIYFVGAFTPAKGIYDFVELSSTVLGAKFYWFTYKISSAQKKKFKSINFIEGLDDKALRNRILKKMDVFICCSHFEGFCLPIAEAMLLLKPVVSYELEEVESEFGDTIEYVDCFNIELFKTKLNSIINSNSYSRDLEKARKFVINNYSPRVVAEKLLNVLDKS